MVRVAANLIAENTGAGAQVAEQILNDALSSIDQQVRQLAEGIVARRKAALISYRP